MKTTIPSTIAPSLIAGLNHAALVTSDAAALAEFYCDVFGATALPVPAPPGSGSALLIQFSDSCGLAVVETPGSDSRAGSSNELHRGHLDHIALDVATPDALEQVRYRLVARGASDGIINDYGAMLSVHFTDPDGMASEVCWMRASVTAGLHPPRRFDGPLADLLSG